MSDVVSGLIGAGGALLGVGLSSVLSMISEAQRRRHENAVRFNDQLRVAVVAMSSKAELVRRTRPSEVGTDEWKNELEAQNWDGRFLRSKEFTQYMEKEYAATKIILNELGLVK